MSLREMFAAMWVRQGGKILWTILCVSLSAGFGGLYAFLHP